MLIMAIVVEFVTPICIVAGVYDRIAAFVLAGFCVVTAFLYHPFWAYPDFWIESDSSQAREHFWQFLKNFGLVGGLLLVVFAGDLAPAEAVLRAPFASTGMPLPQRRSRRPTWAPTLAGPVPAGTILRQEQPARSGAG